MYRVMIIDDEKALRSLLKASVNWKEMGLEIAGEAASGIEAINTIDKFHPDIIFCRYPNALYGRHRIFQDCIKALPWSEDHYTNRF